MVPAATRASVGTASDGFTRTASTTSPRSVNLMALPSRLTRIWRRRVASPQIDLRHAVGDFVEQVEALLGGLGGQQVERALDALAQDEGLVFQLQAARFDLGEVENVVDDGEQGVAARADRLGVIALLARERRIEQQAGHADDAVHRRADFVAHHREEGALGLAGPLGRLLGQPQLLGGAFLLGDVDNGRHFLRLARGLVLVEVHRERRPDHAAIGMDVPLLHREMVDFAAIQLLGQHLLFLAVVRMETAV